MFTVETVASEKNGKYITYFWKKDRTYKVFENAEKRVDALHKQGINARLIEVKK